MKFSIISPVYNVEKYIGETIESVINQTYSDWELILVDDGSTDESGFICDKYAAMDSRITVVHSENQGGYKARLLGNEYITGDYVVGLDSDDMYEPELLEEVGKAIAQHKTDIVIFGITKVYSSGEINPLPFFYDKERVLSKKELLCMMLSARDHSLCDKAIKAELYKSADYIEQEHRLILDDDYLQVVPILCRAESAVMIEKSLYRYRIHDESKSHVIKENHIIDADWVNYNLYKFFKNEGLLDDSIFLELMQSYCKTVYPRLKLLIKEHNIFYFNVTIHDHLPSG